MAAMLVVVAIGVWWFHEALAIAMTGYALSGPIGSMFQRRPPATPDAA
jgi:hypothetical protein